MTTVPPNGKVIVPDTSVLVDGRITMLIREGGLKSARILIPEAVVSELEYQANHGRDTGYSGLDEIIKIQQLKETADLRVEFVGTRPGPSDIELAKSGEIDAMIREVAEEAGGTLVTSDAVQSHVARAKGIDVLYLKPVAGDEEAKDIEFLEITKFFRPDTMSVHLKANVVPLAKHGRPGALELVRLGETPLTEKQLNRMAREILEAAKRDRNSFIELERHGATVVQLGSMRIAIARPPFSDGMEITAVRPVTKLTLDYYRLPKELSDRLSDYQRGVFISGRPGSGKSTFAQAIAEHLAARNVIVKTMESPRDLQVGDAITQYAPLEKDMELTADVLLLVRPDFVVYDEVRKTDDFRVFADLRLAGVGLVGVTHANRAIDAVQRLIGRVELGMIPQVVDTIIHLEKGEIQQVLETSFTVKVPAGMTEADLARPVIEVRDHATKTVEFEIYTYGEQVVVMPIAAARSGRGPTGMARMAERQLAHRLSQLLGGDFRVEFTGEESAILYAEEREIPRIIGKGGANIQAIERELGVKLDVRPAGEAGTKRRQRDWTELSPAFTTAKKNVVLVLEEEHAGETVDVCVDGEVLFEATVSRRGELKVRRGSEHGVALEQAFRGGRRITCRV